MHCGYLPNPMKRGWGEDLCMRDAFATGSHRAKQKPQPEEPRFLLSSGGWTRPPWVVGPGNQRPPGYEPQPGGRGLRQQFHLSEGATRCSVSSSLTRLIRKCDPKSTSYR
jgi:hypothetical protein